MPRGKRNTEYWNYLEASGILEHGSKEEIQKVKRAYRKKYLTELKRQHRSLRPEFIVGFNKANGEYERIQDAAKKHSLKIPSFVRMAALAYITKTFIVPDKARISHLEQLLSECLNQIQQLTSQRERYQWERGRKLEIIEGLIEKAEKNISEALRYPLPIEEYLKLAVKKDPLLSDKLLTILLHDRKNKVT